MATENVLFAPLQIGTIGRCHRVVLAPLTRMRAEEPGLTPTRSHVEYYAQRASPGGLLISEASYISTETHGYPHAPGIFTDSQVDAWRKVTDAVHSKGGKITCQLWHIGRVAHESWKQHPLALAYSDVWQLGVSASAIAIPTGQAKSFSGARAEQTVPRALTTQEIPRLIADYVHSAKCAMLAGFDGVEIHAAHGYLIDQFLNSSSNQRTDQYGGSIENRCRLLFEIVTAVAEVVGVGKIGVRLSPHAPGTITYNGCTDVDPDALYTCAVSGLDTMGVAYLLISEPRWSSANDKLVEKDPGFDMDLVNAVKFRKHFRGVLIAAGGFTPKTARETVEAGLCDAVGFGRWFISNPDLPARIRTGEPLNRYDRKTFYAHGDGGYTDYPSSLEVAMGKGGGKYTQVDQAKIGKSLGGPVLPSKF